MALVVILLAVGLLISLLFAFGNSLPAPTQTVTIEVSGDQGVPYEITCENNRESYTDKGRAPEEYTIDVLTRSSDEDYVRARASKLPNADTMKPTEGDLVNVDLQLVAEDGTVLDEARGDGLLSYSLNSVSVEIDGEDVR